MRALILTIAVMYLLVPNSSSVSICKYTPTVSEAIGHSDAVFVGRVVTETKYGVVFKVDRAWKGVNRRFVKIYTGDIRNDTIPDFVVGENWLVYASKTTVFQNNKTKRKTSQLMALVCNRSALLGYATDDLQKLGTPQKSFR